MEITIDIGKNIYKQITDIAVHEKIDFDIAAIKAIDIGVRVYLSSLEKKSEPDPVLVEILEKLKENNILAKETICHVFNKDKSMLKAYDTATAIQLSESMAKSFTQGKFNI